MEILLILALLIGLWIFIRHDQAKLGNKPESPIARSRIERGFKPGSTSKWLPPLGISLLCAVAFVNEVVNPSRPPFEGRWGWLWSILFSAGGTFGIAVYWALAATITAVVAAVAFHTSRKRAR